MTTRTKKKIINSDYYCSQKFWWLSVDLEKMQTLSCCAATPNKIDTDWLTHNTGQLFNTEELKQERQAMLDAQPVPSCASTCWKPESQGLSSRRLEMKSNQVTHTDVNSDPEVLHLIVGSHCNMTCVYCCKQYSSSWTQDILKNGEYPVITADDRYTINNLDRVLLRLSQKDIGKSTVNHQLITEVVQLSTNKQNPRVSITGGEPFLYLNLEKLISMFPATVKIQVWTGLGVNPTRFATIVDRLCKYPNVSITISAENTDQYYEFNRAGNSWKQFETNLRTLQQKGINYDFNATVGNLTVFGLPEFINYADNHNITYAPCTDPDFLSINVMDLNSKQQVMSTLNRMPVELQKLITESIEAPVTELQKTNLKNYLVEFIKRRNLSLSIFPTAFTQWIYD